MSSSWIKMAESNLKGLLLQMQRRLNKFVKIVMRLITSLGHKDFKMKKITGILLLIGLIGCQKTDLKHPQAREVNNDPVSRFLSPNTPKIVRDKIMMVNRVTDKVKLPLLRNVILLDFDGGIVTGTTWNTSGDISYQPANLTAPE